jgi:VanZ family protein
MQFQQYIALIQNAFPDFWDFVSGLSPWILLSTVATLCDFRFSRQIWVENGKTGKKPNLKHYVDKTVNCYLLVLLAGCLRITADKELGVTALSTTLLVIFASTELVAAWNSFMQLTSLGKKISLVKLLKVVFKWGDIFEDEKDTKNEDSAPVVDNDKTADENPTDSQ